MKGRPLLERLFNLVLAIVLLVGAGLKSYYLSVGDSGLNLHWSVGLLAAAAVVECIVGSGLLVARCGCLTRVSVFALFVVLSMFSFREVVQGRNVCGCFGAFAVSPVYVLIFDVSVIAGVLVFSAPLETFRHASVVRLCSLV